MRRALPIINAPGTLLTTCDQNGCVSTSLQILKKAERQEIEHPVTAMIPLFMGPEQGQRGNRKDELPGFWAPKRIYPSESGQYLGAI